MLHTNPIGLYPHLRRAPEVVRWVGNFFSWKDGVGPAEHLAFSHFVSGWAVTLTSCRHDTVATAGKLYDTLREVLVCFLGAIPFFAPFYGGHLCAVRTLKADSVAPIP